MTDTAAGRIEAFLDCIAVSWTDDDGNEVISPPKPVYGSRLPMLTVGDLRRVLDEHAAMAAQAALDLRAVTTFLVATERADMHPPAPFDPNDHRGRAQFYLRNHFLARIKTAIYADRHFATAIPARETVRTVECRCGCERGQPCRCGLRCACLNNCQVCDAPEGGDVVIGAGSEATSRLPRCPTCGAHKPGWNPVDVECEDCASVPDDENED